MGKMMMTMLLQRAIPLEHFCLLNSILAYEERTNNREREREGWKKHSSKKYTARTHKEAEREKVYVREKLQLQLRIRMKIVCGCRNC